MSLISYSRILSLQYRLNGWGYNVTDIPEKPSGKAIPIFIQAS